MTEPRHRDELTLGYREASALDERRPSDQVRDAVHAHARMLIAAAKQPDTSSEAPPAVAANQSRWKVSAMLASVMLAGLAGLLVLQFDRGTPEEKELVHGAPVPHAVPPPQAGPAPRIVMEKDTRSNSNSPAVLPQGAPAVAPSPAPAAVPKTDVAPRARVAAESLAKSRSEAEPFPVTQAAPSTAAPATVTAEARSEAAPQDAQARPLATGRLASKAEGAPPVAAAPQPASPLHEAARAGNLPELDRLLASGAALNAPDATGKTPLMLAVINNHADLVQRLLAAGANRALVDREGLNALQYARRLGLDRIAGLIEAGS